MNLIRLSDTTIKKYTKQSECTTVETIKKLHLKKLTIPVKCLLLTSSQRVFLQSPHKKQPALIQLHNRLGQPLKDWSKESATSVDIPQDNNHH